MKKILMFGIISISLLSQQKTVNYNNTWGNDLQNKILSMQKQGWEVQNYINLVGYQGSSEGCLVTYEKKSKITSTVIVNYKDIPSKITEITKKCSHDIGGFATGVPDNNHLLAIDSATSSAILLLAAFGFLI